MITPLTLGKFVSRLISSLFFTLILVGFAAPALAKSNWSQRCAEGDNQKCELFQRLIVEDQGSRFAEMAIGKTSESEETYRAMIILPLGLLIPEGVTITIDDEEIGKSIPQFCVQDGCLVALDLQQQNMLQRLKKGKDITFAFKAPDGTAMSASFTLKGLTKALRALPRD